MANLDVSLMITTTSSREEAKTIAVTLLEEKLVACVNIVDKVTSLYRWEGHLCEEDEFLLVMKTSANLVDTVIERIPQLHSYDTPEVLALPLIAGSERYLNWVGNEVRPPQNSDE